MKKVVLFAFNGDLMCFVHVLLNALDMKDRGYQVKIVVEGSATRLIPELAKGETPMSPLYKKAKALDLIDGACRACSNKMGVLGEIQKEGLNLLGDMTGHPGMARYREDGFDIITF